MKKIKEKKTRQSRKSVLLLLFFLSIISVSCKDDCPCPEHEEVKDQYYVKYVVESSTIYSVSRIAEINSADNTTMDFTFGDRKWEVIIGPVEKNFQATLDASYNTSQSLAQTYIDVEIYVSKNDSPFAIKTSNISENVRMSASTSYTID